MNNLVFGILTLVFCAAGYFYSWKLQRLGNFKMAVLLLMVCGLVLRVYTASDFYLHEWDERYHALVAKNLIGHPLRPTLYEHPLLPYDYTMWAGNHVWVHKQPLPLWTMALSLRLFGINEIALRLPSILLSTLGIGLTFSVARFFFNQKVAWMAAFLYSINGLIIELAAGRVATDHIDVFFLFFVELAIFFSILFVQKQKNVFNLLAGASIGAAILCKWLPALVVLPIWLLLVTGSGNFKPKQMVWGFMLLVATCVLVFVPWQWYINVAFPAEAAWEAQMHVRHVTEVLEKQGGPFYYFADRIRINYGELIYLPLLWFIWQTFRHPKDRKNWAIFTWFFVPFIFFSFPKTKMQGYILFAVPALFMMASAFWYWLYEYGKNHKLKWLFQVVLLLLLALPVRYTLERVKPFEHMERAPQWANDLKQLNKKNITNGVLFNYNRPVEAMFYTNLTTYPQIPHKEKIQELLASGYTVIINDDGTIPADIRSINGVLTERLATGNSD